MATQETKLDSVVTAVINSFKQRAEFGQKKYGTNLDRTDLTTLDWIQHAQEEHMDAILYLEKLKQCFQKQASPLEGVKTQAPLQKEEEEGVKAPLSQKEETKKNSDQVDEKYLSHWGC